MAEADDDDGLVDRVHSLSDIELAVLLSLISKGHCVIGTPKTAIDDLVDELRLISQNIFGLRCAVSNYRADTTLEEFATSLLLPGAPPDGLGVTGGASGSSHSDYAGPRAATGSSHHAHGGSTADYFRLHAALLEPPQASGARSPRSPSPTIGLTSANAAATPAAASLRMANVLIAKNLNCAPDAVQIQALELVHTHRMFTATAMQAAPRPFLLVAVVAADRGFYWDGSGHNTEQSSGHPADELPSRPPHMTAHLNDAFAMGHWHDPEDGFPNLEERDEDGGGDDAGADSGSMIRRSESSQRARSGSNSASITSRSTLATQSSQSEPPPSFSAADIGRLAALSKDVRVDMEVLRYQMNVVGFLRMHRAVAVMGPATGGLSCISPTATKHFKRLAQCLAPLHRLDYVTPALVALAARKTYLHRICTIPVGREGARPLVVHERSMQWGSEKAAVEALLDGVSPEDVIEDVLGSVVPPV